jgi:hypothetical protein
VAGRVRPHDDAAFVHRRLHSRPRPDDHAGYKAALDIAEKPRARQREIDRQQAEAVPRAEQAQAAGAPVANGAIQDDADPTTIKLPSVVAKSAGCPFEHDIGSLAQQGQSLSIAVLINGPDWQADGPRVCSVPRCQ